MSIKDELPIAQLAPPRKPHAAGRRPAPLDRNPRRRLDDKRRLVARRLVDALTCAHCLSSRLHAESAQSLDRLHAAGAHHMLGFSSFGDFARESLGLTPGTVRDRLKLHDVLCGSAPIAAGFSRGEISESIAIALLPLARKGLTGEAAEHWTAVAREMSVRQIRAAVRDALREGDASPGRDGPCDRDIQLNLDATTVSSIENEDSEGETVSFRGPVPVARMFDQAIETARKVLGSHAARYKCVEALLAETSSEWQRLEPELEERLARRSEQRMPQPADPGPESPLEWVEPSGIGAQPIHCAASETGAVPAIVVENRDRASAVRIVLVPRPDPVLLAGALHTADRIERELAEIMDLVSTDGAIDQSGSGSEDGARSDVAARAGSDEGTSPPSSGPSAAALESATLGSLITRIVALEQLDAPLRIYRAEILRELRDTGAMASLGYSSWIQFTQDYLGLSERAARSLVAEGRLFASEAALRDAYGRGELPLGKAFLLRRIARSCRVREQIERASAVTHRQLAREVRLLEWARSVGVQLTLNRSAAAMEETLMLALARWGWTRRRVRDLLDAAGLAGPTTGDPATDPGAMNRLERLIDLLILTIWDEPPQDGGSPDPADDSPDNDRRTSTHANAMMEVRFWAPHPIAQDWRTALGRIRESRGVGCPPWVAVSILVAEATQEWDKQDPRRIPTEEKLLLRDGYHCMVPICSSRRNLEAHHIHFRSAGGSDKDENKVTLCHAHHRMLHDGAIRAWGRAPHDLHWEIGCKLDGPPLMRLKGNRIIWRSSGQ